MTRTLGRGKVAIDFASELEGAKVLDGVEDGCGCDEELPSCEERRGKSWKRVSKGLKKRVGLTREHGRKREGCVT